MAKHDLDDLIGVAEAGELAGVSSAAATMWRLRNEDFPKPLLTLRCGTIYSRKAVTAWLVKTGRAKASPASSLRRCGACRDLSDTHVDGCDGTWGR